MLEAILEVVVGALVEFWLAVVEQQRRVTHQLYAIALIALPLFYAVFGLSSGQTDVIGSELIYGLPFFIVGCACFIYDFKYTGYIVAAMWFLHGSYDLSHEIFFINPGVPAWYPVTCLAIDFIVGSWILYQEIAGQNGRNSLPSPMADATPIDSE